MRLLSSRIRTESLLRYRVACWLFIAVASALAVAPFYRLGSPSGHDFEFHVYSWMDVLAQWKQSVVYPRWAALAHWGYGEPRFLFYPPISWMLGAALGSVLPWKVVPGAFCWLALTLAGAGMFRLAREWLEPADSLFAAVFYALNPYHLLVVYWRSAYAELLCAGLLPLLLLFVVRLNEASFRPALWLSLVLAGAWLTNGPAAVMLHYSAIGLGVLTAVREKSGRPLWRLAWAALLGAGLVSFYLVPAIYEQRWVNIAEVLSPGVRPQDNFLFTRNGDPDHNHFNLLVSLVALAEMVVLACGIFFSRQERYKNALWKPLAIWGTATFLATLSFSNVFWEYLPKFRFIQLPFRCLLCVNVAVAILLTMATRRSAIWRLVVRGLACIALLAVVIFVGWRTQPPWWATAGDVEDMQRSVADGTGYEGVDEYVPAGADPDELNKDLPRLSDAAGSADSDLTGNSAPVKGQVGNTRIINEKIIQWDATDKHFRVLTKSPANLTVRLFNYPAWKAVVNGRRVVTATSEVTGLMIVPLEAGENDVEIRFTRTFDRSLGDKASLLSLAVLAAAWVATRPKPELRADPRPTL